MKRLLISATAFALVATLGACKQEATTGAEAASQATKGTGIDGTWVVDLASAKFDGKPTDLLIKDGTYTCSSCVPPLTSPADGAFHPVTGRDYADSISVTIDSPSQITLATRKGDLPMGTTTFAVAADGKSLTRSFTDTSVKGAEPVTGSSTLTRVGEAPAGAHAVSGQWKLAKLDKMSEGGMSITFASTADTLKMTSPDGTSYEAKLDGTDAPVVGDPAGATVSVTKTSENAWQFVNKVKGKETSTANLTIDGDTATLSSKDARSGNVSTYTAMRK